ncbi:MAG: glycosyltransferase family 4 protein [Saprospiraceae bacterium]|nr:glycosyltransferase family 4 protein [Saprospiraceae bacterium]
MDQSIVNKKIGLVANTAWNLFHFRAELMSRLKEDGNEVFCIAPADGNEKKLEPYCHRFVALEKLQRKGTSAKTDLALYHELVFIFKELQLDLVLCYTVKPNIYGTLAAHRLNIPTVNTITGLGFAFLENRLINKIVVRLYKYALQKSARVIFQNKDDRHLFIKKGLVKAGRTTLVRGSGINTDFFNPSKNVERLDDKIRFLFVGRLLYDKGVMELLHGFTEAAAMVNNLQLHLVGDTDSGNPASVEETDLLPFRTRNDITFHGYEEDVIPYLAPADVVILPSYREGLPRVILEGMSMGKPVITTNVPGCKEMVVNGQNGILVDVKSSQAIASAIQKMALLKKEQRHQMGAWARQEVLNKYSSEAVIQSYYLILHDIFAGQRGLKKIN